jgi:hypothetical protein
MDLASANGSAIDTAYSTIHYSSATAGQSFDTARFDKSGGHIHGTIVALNPTTVGTDETWHNLALSAGFAAAGAPNSTPGYQLEPGNAGRVRLRGRVNLTANQIAGATFATLPTQYRSAWNQELPGSNNLSGITAGRAPIFFTASNGTLSLTVAGTNGNFFELNGMTLELD